MAAEMPRCYYSQQLGGSGFGGFSGASGLLTARLWKLSAPAPRGWPARVKMPESDASSHPREEMGEHLFRTLAERNRIFSSEPWGLGIKPGNKMKCH